MAAYTAEKVSIENSQNSVFINSKEATTHVNRGDFLVIVQHHFIEEIQATGFDISGTPYIEVGRPWRGEDIENAEALVIPSTVNFKEAVEVIRSAGELFNNNTKSLHDWLTTYGVVTFTNVNQETMELKSLPVLVEEMGVNASPTEPTGTKSGNFINTASLIAYEGHKAGDRCYTDFYDHMGDSGGGQYTIVYASSIPEGTIIDEVGNFTLSKGLYAILEHKNAGEIDVHQYGAKGDVVNGQGTNDLKAFRAALAQTKAWSRLLKVQTWETMTGGLVRMRARNYGILVTDEDLENGMDCALPVSRRTGLVGAGRNLTMLTCLDGFAPVPVVANELHIDKFFDDFVEVGNFQILGRWYHGDRCRASHGIKMNMSKGSGNRTDNFSRFYNIFVENVYGIGVYTSGRGEQAWDNVQANHNVVGWHMHELVDSFITRCNAGGNLKTGFKVYKCASTKFTTCKSYYNGKDGKDKQGDSANWYIYGDSFVSGRVTYSQCESQEAHGSGFVILNGDNLFINCLSTDPKREGLTNEDNIRPDHSVCFYLGSWISGWEQSMAMNNNFSNCMAGHNLTTSYSDLNGKSYMGDGALYIESRSRDNTGNIIIQPRAYCDQVFLGGKGIGDNPLLTVMGESLKDGTPPSQAVMFYKNELAGVRVYGNQKQERNHAVTDYLVYANDETATWIDPKVSSLLKGLEENTEYELRSIPYSRVGSGLESTQSFTRKLTRKAAMNSEGMGFEADRPLIDLEQGTIRFSFTVGDRLDKSLQLQSLVHQGDGTVTELFISLYEEYSLRISVGGNTFEGLGSGKKFENGTFDVVIYPVGLEIYSGGILYSAAEDFIRGDLRADPTLNKTKFAKAHPQTEYLDTVDLKGQILGFSSPKATIIFDNDTDGLQSVVAGELDTQVTEVGDFTGAWEEVPLVV